MSNKENNRNGGQYLIGYKYGSGWVILGRHNLIPERESKVFIQRHKRTQIVIDRTPVRGIKAEAN